MPITDMAAMKRKFEATKSNSGSMWKPKYGANKEEAHENKVKVFSWPPTGGQLGKRVFFHYGLGSDGKKKAICPRTNGIAHKCAACDFIDEAGKSQDPAMVKRAENIKQVERFMILVADLDLYDASKKKYVGAYDCSPNIYRKLMQQMTSENYDFTAWTSLPVKIVGYRRGPGNPSSVELAYGIKEVTLVPDEWLPVVPNLAAIVLPPSPEVMQLLVDGKELDEDEPDTTTEEAAPTTTKAEPAPVEKKVEAKPEPVEEKKEAPVETKTEAPTETAAAPAQPKAKMSLQDLLKKK